MMSLSILLLTLVVSVLGQSTLLDGQCDNDCYLQSKVEIQNLFATMERNIRDVITSNRNKELEQEVQTQKDTINQLQAEILQLKSKNQTADIDSNTYQDCYDIKGLGHKTNGVYEVNIGNRKTKQIYCEMTGNGTNSWNAWTRILHRQDNLTDFTYKKFVEYEAGFGDPQGSHWMGLAYMHRLMTFHPHKLRVDLTDWDGNTAYAEFSTFHVGPASTKYQLALGGYSGTAGHSMTLSTDMSFTTIDQDNNHLSHVHCADGTGYHTGGWWYELCPVNGRLTGPYIANGTNVTAHHGIQWPTWRGDRYSYKVATMKMQRLFF